MVVNSPKASKERANLCKWLVRTIIILFAQNDDD